MRDECALVREQCVSCYGETGGKRHREVKEATAGGQTFLGHTNKSVKRAISESLD